MVEMLDIAIAGEPVRLFADRALYWPARRRLLIADLHLGKSDTFRAFGIAVPSGGTAHDLQRLDTLLQLCNARELWILGDFLHAAHRARADAQWRQFREGHHSVEISVVLGNHDRSLQAQLGGISIIADGIQEGPFEFRHAPQPMASGSTPASHLICGHLHPVLRLPGLGRLPAFWLRTNISVLPAFSVFTGGWQIPANNADRIVVCNGQQLQMVGGAYGVA